MTDYLRTPTDDEVGKVLKKRDVLFSHHKILFRKINDLRGALNSDKDKVIDAFTSWCKTKYDIQPYDSILYYFYTLTRTQKVLTYCDEIRRFLYYGEYFHRLNGMDFNSRKFNNFDEALKWILAYRATQIYLIGKLSDYTCPETCTC